MSRYPALWRRRAGIGRVAVLGLVVISVSWLGFAASACAVVQAPGFSVGPRVVSAGLLWEGQEGVYLSDAASTRLIVAHAGLADVAVDDGWVVVAEPRGLEAGRIAGPLAPVAGLRRCPPIRATGFFSGESTVETVADGDLYAVVRGGCVGGRPKQAEFVVRVHLGSRRLNMVGKVPSGAVSLAAAGSRLALTYKLGRENRVRVDVVDSRDARPLYSLITPPGEAKAFYGETTIDATGDVLVAGDEPNPVPGPLLSSPEQAWWGDSRTRIAHPLGVRFAALSEGHIAYAPSGNVKGERIDVLNIAAGTTRTAVTFSGSASLEGFGLGAHVLAWSQQSYAYKLTPRSLCVGLFAVSPTELTEVPLSESGPPITVNASPGTPPAGEPCPVPK